MPDVYKRQSILGVSRRHPMECALDFTHTSGHTAQCVGIISTVDLHDISILVLLDILTLDDVGAFQSYLTAGSETEEFLGRIFHEVITFNVYFAREMCIRDS